MYDYNVLNVELRKTKKGARELYSLSKNMQTLQRDLVLFIKVVAIEH